MSLSGVSSVAKTCYLWHCLGGVGLGVGGKGLVYYCSQEVCSVQKKNSLHGPL